MKPSTNKQIYGSLTRLRCLVGGLFLAHLLGCTPSPEWVKAQRDKVRVTLVATGAGYKIRPFSSQELVAEFIDLDGVDVKRAWPAHALSAAMMSQFKYCMDKTSAGTRYFWSADSSEVPLIRDSMTRCSMQAGFPVPTESIQPTTKGFDLRLMVASSSMGSGEGIQIYSNGVRNLGAALHVNRNRLEYKTASHDVDQCLTLAASHGVIESMKSQPSANSDFGMTFESQSISPFTGRFSECMRGNGYSISDIK